VGKAIYAIDAFPDDAQLWRIDWIGGVAYNASFPSEPLIDACLARFPNGETNPLSKKFGCGTLKRALATTAGRFFCISLSLWARSEPSGYNTPLQSDFSRRELPITLFAYQHQHSRFFNGLLGSRTGKK